MLGIVIALFAGGLIGLCIGVWLVADNVRHSPDGCLVCGRTWHDHTDPGAHIHVIERAPNVRVLPQTQGDHHE